MGYMRLSLMVLFGLMALGSSKPIMVTFGTNQGPIVPRPKPSPSLEPKTIVARSPAPVSEAIEDIPNPSTYRPLLPHQYRTQLFSHQPPPNLILGTPIDQKYTPSINKNEISRNDQVLSIGVDYTGPNLFEKQEYEIIEAKKLKTTLQPSVSYIKPHYYQKLNKINYPNKFVPQIGIIFSSGLKYYIPQFNGNYQQGVDEREEQENSVYDQDDRKYYNEKVQ